MVTLQVKVVPGASRSRIAGWLGDALKIQVAAAPERGKANAAVIDVLSEALGIKPSQISVASGHTQPRKTLRIEGVEPPDLETRLAAFR